MTAFDEHDPLELVDARPASGVGVGDDHGGELHAEEGLSRGLAVVQDVVIVVPEHGHLAGRLIVALAVAPGAVASAVGLLHFLFVVVADLLDDEVQAGDFDVDVAPSVVDTVDFDAHRVLSSFR